MEPRKRRPIIEPTVTPIQPPKEKWYKTFLMYPTLAIAILSAIPSHYDTILAMINGTTVAGLAQEKHRTELWSKNADCMQRNAIEIQDDQGFDVKVRLCSSSLFLVEKMVTPKKSIYSWVEIGEPVKTAFFSPTLLAQNHGNIRVNESVNPNRILCMIQKDDSIIQVLQNRQSGLCMRVEINHKSGESTKLSVKCEVKCE